MIIISGTLYMCLYDDKIANIISLALTFLS